MIKNGDNVKGTKRKENKRQDVEIRNSSLVFHRWVVVADGKNMDENEREGEGESKDELVEGGGCRTVNEYFSGNCCMPWGCL